MSRTKGPITLPNEGFTFSFMPDDPMSMKDIVATLYRKDVVIGRIRMNWSHWPSSYHLYGKKFFEVFDLLAELGRSRMLNEKKD